MENQDQDIARQKLIELLKIKPKNIELLKKKGLEELIQELEIYQYEIELQNEELKRANEQLQKLEQNYYILFNNSPNGLVVLDKQFKVKQINDTLVNLLAVKKSNIINSDIREYILPNYQNDFYIFFNNLFNNRKGSINLFVNSKIGRIYDVYIEGICKESLETKETEVLLSIFDVGRFRQEITKISQYEEMYRFLERFPDPVIVHINGEIVYTNSSTFKVFDLKKDDLIGHNIFEYIHPNDHKRVLENIERAKMGLPFLDEYEITLINKNKKLFNVNLTITTIEHDGNKGDIVVIKDITKLRQQNIQLQDLISYNIIKSVIWSKKDFQSEQKLINTFILHTKQEYELAGIVYLIKDGDCFYPNTFLGNFEFNVNTLKIDIKLKLNFDYYIPQIDEKGEIVDYRIFIGDEETTNITKKMSILPFYIDNILNGIFLFYDTESEKFNRNFNVIKNLIEEVAFIISEKRMKLTIDEQMNKLNRETQELNRIRNNFYMRVSNEIRAPILPILGFTNYLLNEFKLPKEVTETLQIIYLSSQNILKKLSNTIDLVRLETENFFVEKSKFDMLDFINQISQQYYERARQNKYNFNIELEPELNKSFVGDYVRIGEILQNLLDNAFQYIDTKKKTHEIDLVIRKTDIKSSLDDENTVWIEFLVNDNGIGMDETKINEILEMSTVKSYSLYTAYEGKGLGLALSVSIANKLGGFINVRSEKGVGSEFKLVLPLIEK